MLNNEPLLLFQQFRIKFIMMTSHNVLIYDNIINCRIVLIETNIIFKYFSIPILEIPQRPPTLFSVMFITI